MIVSRFMHRLRNYQPGQVLVFHRASRGIEKHEALTVTGVSSFSIQARAERGAEKSVALTQARSFSVHERTEIEVSAGDKLLMMGNRKEPGQAQWFLANESLQRLDAK